MSIFAVGGNVGFALAPVVVTPTMLALGTGATPLLVIPAVLMAPVLLILQPRLAARAAAAAKTAKAAPAERDDWRSFAWLTALVICRSILFFGLSSLLALYVMDQVGADKATGGAALTCFLTAGAVATLIGGWLADRHGRLVPIRLGYALTVPALLALLLAPTVPVALVCATALGLAVYLPFSVQITLGQEYLPNRLGTASGVTLGLAVSAGGLAMPLLGLIAEQHGPRGAFVALAIAPLAAVVLSTALREPSPERLRDAESVIPRR
jgi:FSR family fosmidomycin resistance protein-like MFS transporter